MGIFRLMRSGISSASVWVVCAAMLLGLVAACTGGSAERVEQTDTGSGGDTTSSTAAAEVEDSPTTTRSAAEFDPGYGPDPRRGRVADLDDPVERQWALLGMAITPDDIDPRLADFVPLRPLAADQATAGFASHIYALEAGPEAFPPGVAEGYTIEYGISGLSASGVDRFAVDFLITSDPTATTRSYADDVVDLVEMLESRGVEGFTAERIEQPGGFTARLRGAGSFNLIVMTVGNLVVVVSVGGDDAGAVDDLADAIAGAARDRVEAVLAGDYGYGPFDDVSQHVSSAEWTLTAGVANPPMVVLVELEGAFLAGAGSSCSARVEGFTLELAFDTVGLGHVRMDDEAEATNLDAWPFLGSCGRSSPSLPAYFSRAESPHVGAFMRNVPDLGEATAVSVDRNGIDTVRYDVAGAYAGYLERLEVDGVEVDRFDLWLESTNGWVAGWAVELSGDELESYGFGPTSAEGYLEEFRVTAVDEPDVTVVVDTPDRVRTPDDAMVAFALAAPGVGGSDIYLREPSGVVRRLTSHPADDERPAISPDGTTIVFTSQRNWNDSLFLIDIDGSNLRRLTAPLVDGGDSWPSWSPDGGSIVFGSNREPFDDDLWIIESDGTGLRKLFGESGSGEYQPAWSPAGDLIAFVSDMDQGRWDVYAIRPDGTGLFPVTTDGFDEEGLEVAWSPDGHRLLVSGFEDGAAVMYLMDSDGSNREAVETGGIPGGGGVFTPSGDYIVFIDTSVDAGLWSVAMDGTDLRPLAVRPGFYGHASVGVHTSDR